jgi:iron complex outermembrane recepter protein
MHLRPPQPVSFRHVRKTLCVLTALICAGTLPQVAVNAAETSAAARSPSGTVVGRVFNATSGTYLNNARVTVEGTSILALTSDSGEFRLSGVPTGTAKIKVSYAGQSDLVEMVLVDPSTPTTANFTFNAGKTNTEAKSVVLDKFVVESQRHRNARELANNEERVSDTIKSVVALDSLGYMSDGNIGDFVRFMPGVDVSNGSTTGSASNPDNAVSVSVRGFGADSTAVLIDGMPIASGSGESLTRTVQLDAVSINNANRLEIIKVATPDMPQDSPGGAINLITRGAFELARATSDLSVAFNGNTNTPQLFKRTPGPYGPQFKTLPSVRFSTSLPLSKTFGVSFSVASDNKYSLTRNSNMRDWFLAGRTVTIDGATLPVANAKGGIRIDNPLIDRFELNDNQWIDRRLSGNVRLDWRPFPGLEIRANGQLSTMENQGVTRRTQWRYTNGAGVLDWGDGYVKGRQRTATFNPGNSASMTTDARDKEGFTTAGYLTLKYRRNLWSLDAKVSASESYHSLPDEKNGHFSSVDASFTPGRMDLTGVSKGVVGDIKIWDTNGNPVNYGNMSAWNPILNSGFAARTSEVHSRDLMKQYNLDLSREINFLPFPVNLKVGAMQREKSNRKWGKGTGYRWNYVGPSTGLPTNSQFQSEFATEAKYGYATPQYWADPGKIHQYFKAHPDYFSDSFISPTTNVNIPAGNYLSRVGTAKGLTLTDTDWFGMATARLFRNRLTVIGGARQSLKDTVGYNVFNDPTYQFVKLKDGTLYRDSIYPNGVRYDGTANPGNKPADAVITDVALRSRMQAAGVAYLPTQLELAPNGIAVGNRDNNLHLARLARYTRDIDTSVKQPYTPQLQLAYEITHNLRLQVAWSKETRLPDLEGAQGLIVGGASFQILENQVPTTDIGGDGTITIANVKGRPEVNQSYNGKLSYFPNKGRSRYSISYYYKVVDKSWETVNVFNTDSEYDSLLDSIGVSRDDYQNYAISTTTATGLKQIRKGFEIEAEQNLGVLADWAKGIDIFATYTRRPVTARSGGTNVLGFVSMVPVRAKWTGGVSYSARRFSVQARWTYTEAGITHSSATSVTLPDGTTKTVQFYNPNKVPAEVNIQGNYLLSKRLTLFAVANRVLSQRTYGRITDSITRYMPDYASYRTLQDRGIALSAGIRARF